MILSINYNIGNDVFFMVNGLLKYGTIVSINAKITSEEEDECDIEYTVEDLSAQNSGILDSDNLPNTYRVKQNMVSQSQYNFESFFYEKALAAKKMRNEKIELEKQEKENKSEDEKLNVVLDQQTDLPF